MTEPVRIEHALQSSAAMHILLTVAMQRLDLMVLETTQEEYEAAIAGTNDLRLTFNGATYRAERLP